MKSNVQKWKWYRVVSTLQNETESEKLGASCHCSNDVWVWCHRRHLHRHRRHQLRLHSHSLRHPFVPLLSLKHPSFQFPLACRNRGILSQFGSKFTPFCRFKPLSGFIVLQWFWSSTGYVQFHSSSLRWSFLPIKAMAQTDSIPKSASPSFAAGNSLFPFSPALLFFWG